MIDQSLVPGHVRAMVLEAETYTEAEWRRVTSGWNPFYQQLARTMRQIGEGERKKLLFGGGTVKLERLFDFDDTMDLTIAIICLSDASLDKAIGMFPS
jgi:hypothetical protein